MSCEGGSVPLWSLVMKQMLISKPVRIWLFYFLPAEILPLLGLLAIPYGIDWIFSCILSFLRTPHGYGFCFSFSLPTVGSGGLLEVSESYIATNILLPTAIPGGVSIFSSFMPRKGNSSRPLAMQREPVSSPDTWGACLIPVPYGGNQSWPCQPPATLALTYSCDFLLLS